LRHLDRHGVPGQVWPSPCTNNCSRPATPAGLYCEDDHQSHAGQRRGDGPRRLEQPHAANYAGPIRVLAGPQTWRPASGDLLATSGRHRRRGRGQAGKAQCQGLFDGESSILAWTADVGDTPGRRARCAGASPSPPPS
jgi:hypothetical protein